LADFCSRHHITPAIREFHDEDETGPDLCLSDQSSDIEEECELKKFTQALQKAQRAALKKEVKNKKTIYSKRSKRTLKRRIEFRNKLASKGFLPVDEYIRLKRKTEEGNNTDTPEGDIISAVREESEEDSDEANTLARDTCAHRGINSTSEVESEEDLPMHDVRPHLRRHICMESEESTGDDDDGGAEDYARQCMSDSEDKTDIKEMLTASEHLEIL
jgi:hypothetical protein